MIIQLIVISSGYRLPYTDKRYLIQHVYIKGSTQFVIFFCGLVGTKRKARVNGKRKNLEKKNNGIGERERNEYW